MPLYFKQINNRPWKGHGIFYSHVPKCGGTTIETSLRKEGFDEFLFSSNSRGGCFKQNLQHLPSSIFNQVIDLDNISCKFIVVRNPFNRLISEYKYRTKGHKKLYDWLKINFEKFSHNSRHLDNHLLPQVEFHDERLEVFRIEDGLDEVYDFIGDSIGVNFPYDGVKKNVSDSRRVKSDLFENDEEYKYFIKIVLDNYRKDFEKFDYLDSFEQY